MLKVYEWKGSQVRERSIRSRKLLAEMMLFMGGGGGGVEGGGDLSFKRVQIFHYNNNNCSPDIQSGSNLFLSNIQINTKENGIMINIA